MVNNTITSMTSEPESSPVVPAEETKWWEIHAELQVNNKLCYFENDIEIWSTRVEQTLRKLMIWSLYNTRKMVQCFLPVAQRRGQMML